MKVRQTSLKKILSALAYLFLASFSTSNANFNAHRKCIAPLSQFSYDHTTEIAFNQEPGFALDEKIETFAKQINRHLNSSMHFQTDFIVNAKKVRNFHLKEKPCKGQTGQLFQVTTQDNVLISGTFFDRGSDTLIIIGTGFTNAREKMTPFVDMFPDYDVVLFDFRGHGYKEFSFFNPKTWPSGLSEFILGVNPSLVTLGLYEEKDIFAIVDYCKQKKQYKSVNGLGICYGAFNLLKAACLRPNLFNKLILDGCWLNLSLFVKKVKKDPKLMLSPQKGGWTNKWPFTNKVFMKGCDILINKLMGLRYDVDISITDYLPSLDPQLPILFFYGKNDLVIYRNEFETIWNGLTSEKKVAVITSNPHVINHLKQAGFCKLMYESFLELDWNIFSNYIKNSNLLAQYYINKYANKFLN